MKTMQQEWEEYRKKCYPGGMPDFQERQIHQAFFAGALVSITLLREAAALPKPESGKALLAVEIEVLEICRARAATYESRN